ncbi:L-threonine dehydratase catabolic TdcB [Leclercia adecarboxylata]|uniref:L-threonine dehydratase catabolic TdcB n=1 Tax=Leclercia adecarboxylata TaxID=83655 RepID=A0A4U9IPJ5_9ENTR|nr:L-threonine dehydratase catabolic TdcB [Leclercia adecarboxylata]
MSRWKGVFSFLPYDDALVIAGQGTIGLEILEDLYDVDNVIVPIGGGGLIAGIATAIKSINPTINIIGVQAENVHGMASSYSAGEIMNHRTGRNISRRLRCFPPGQINVRNCAGISGRHCAGERRRYSQQHDRPSSSVNKVVTGRCRCPGYRCAIERQAGSLHSGPQNREHYFRRQYRSLPRFTHHWLS